MAPVVSEIDIPGVTLFRRGKVRDTFELGDSLLMVASDRLSAFDVVLPTPIPLKGIILTQLSRFWFVQTKEIVPNHLITDSIRDFPAELAEHSRTLAGRSMIVKKAERIDVECVVRGYVAGSAWNEYQHSQTIAGLPIREGMIQADQLPEPIFTPAMKNDNDRSGQPTLWDEAAEHEAIGVRRRGAARQQRGPSEASELWTIDQVADYLGVPKQTVYCWRTSGYGPTGFRGGKHVRWRASTVIAWTLELERQR
jgi:phosphoribosylaminoimidazole-succinocarboxamide synthase